MLSKETKREIFNEEISDGKFLMQITWARSFEMKQTKQFLKNFHIYSDILFLYLVGLKHIYYTYLQYKGSV